MEQQNKHSAYPLQGAAVKWASEVLDLDPQLCNDPRKNQNTPAVAAFFESLQANGFYADSDRAQAVELLLGKSPAAAPAFQNHLNRQGFHRLDDAVEWFANELGVAQGDRLLEAMKARLANLNLDGCSDDIHDYAQWIWQTALAVNRQIIAGDGASLRIIQALFHISAVRQTQRCRIRSQWTAKLRSEFSVADLDTAKKSIQQKAVLPGAQFHRPFLFMLTREKTDLNQLRLPPPVDSRRSFDTGVKIQRNAASTTTSPNFDRFVKYFFLLMLVLFGAGFVSNLNRTTTNPSKDIKTKANQEKNDKIFKTYEDQARQRFKHPRFDQQLNKTLTDDMPPTAPDPNFDPIRIPAGRSLHKSMIDQHRRRARDLIQRHHLDPPDRLNNSSPDSKEAIDQ